MKKILTLLLLSLFSGIALGQYDYKLDPGVSTTIYQSTVGRYGTVQSALEQAFSGDSTGTVAFAAPGSYTFTGAATLTRSRKTLVIPKTVTLIPGSGSVGIATFSGDDVTVSGGGKVLVETAVNDQTVLAFTGSRCTITDVTFHVTATGGLTTNPISLVALTGSNGSRVSNNRFYPQIGITCIKSTAGTGNSFCENDFIPAETTVYEASDPEIQSSHATTTYLGSVWRCIDLQHDGWAIVRGNRARYLGRPTANADCFLNYDFDSTYYPDAEGGLHEAGHLQFLGNYIEDCPMPAYVRLNGLRWGQIIGNSFANSLSGIATTAEAALILDIGDEEAVITAANIAVTGTDTYEGTLLHIPQAGDRIYVTGSLTDPANLGWKTVVTADATSIEVSETLVNETNQTTTIISGHPTDDVIVSGNQFHNIPFATTSASDILLGHAFRILIQGNQFSNNLGEYSVTFEDPDLAKDITIVGNSFEGKAWFLGSENQPTSPIHMIGGSSAARYVMSANTFTGYSGAFITKDAGVTGAIFESGLQDLSDGDAADASTAIENLTTNIKNDQ